LSGTFGVGLCGKARGKFFCSVATARAAASADVCRGLDRCLISPPALTRNDVTFETSFVPNGVLIQVRFKRSELFEAHRSCLR
jgi:hypothetical protein